MATLTVQDLVEDGIDPTYAAADAAGDEFAWEKGVFLHVKNGDASSHTVTVASQWSNLRPGLATDDLAVAVPAGEERLIGPLYRPAYRDSDGNVQVSYDAVTSVTVGVFAVSQ